MVVAGVRRRMTPSAFKQSLNRKTPPAGVSTALQALWWAAGGDWDKAHRIVMSGHDQECAWVHAHLHRVEGDLDNARALPGPSDGPAVRLGFRGVRGADRGSGA